MPANLVFHPALWVGLLLAGSLGLGAPSAAQAPPPPPAGFQAAHEAYANGHYENAFRAFSQLADDGHAESARIALQMHRYGPMLYRLPLAASPAQVRAWRGTLAAAAMRPAPVRAAAVASAP